MVQLESDSAYGNIALPIYRRIEEDLRARIRDGRWAASSQIPGRRELARRYKVEVNTVQRAITILIDDGLLRAEPGKGTFVSDGVGSPAAAPAMRSLRLGIALGDAEAISDSDSYIVHIVRGVRRALAPHGLRHSVTFVEDWDFDALSSIPRSELSGLLLVSPDTDKRAQIDQFWRAGLPVVVVGSSWPGIDAPYVDCDNYSGISEAISHLVKLGHEKIGCAVVCAHSCHHRDRAEAFRRVLIEYGLPLSPEHIIERWKPTVEEGNAAIHAMLNSPDRPSALIMLSDVAALQALIIARNLGLKSPEDLSIITFDNTQAAMHAEPPLTTVAPPFEEMGQKGAQLLLDLCAGQPFEHSPALLPMRVIKRGSTARPCQHGARSMSGH